MSAVSWVSTFEGWYGRASTSSSDVFTSEKHSLVLAALVDTPARQDTLMVAFFKPNVAVDSSGQVFTLAQADFDGISSLAGQVLTLPQTGSFQNQWRIHHPTTSKPIYKLYVADGEHLTLTSVYGYDKGVRKLKATTAGYENLPDALYKLCGLLEEGIQNANGGGTDVVTKVKTLINSNEGDNSAGRPTFCQSYVAFVSMT